MQDAPLSPPKFQFVLASQSLRRKELVGHLQIPFLQLSADIEEVSEQKNPSDIVLDLAAQKGEAVAQKLLDSQTPLENPFILSSDTLVCLQNMVLGKPKDEKEAKKTLQMLSGKTHTVFTGVSLRYRHPLFGQSWKISSFYSMTHVSFGEIDEETLNLYLASGDSLDKAGAYGIQGMGLSFIKSLEGPYSSVVGLPLAQLNEKLSEILGHYPGTQGWRSWFTKP